MPVAKVNDIELNYKLEGDGEETIVLINGLADDVKTTRTPGGTRITLSFERAVLPESGLVEGVKS